MTTTEAPQVRQQAGAGGAGHGESAGGWRHFVRHYVEMVAAMIVGMLAGGATAAGVEAVSGLEPLASPELTSLAMALAMGAAMIGWMRHRGHRWAHTLEMAGAMLAPALVLIPLLWLGVIGGEALLLVEHIVMLPLMYLVMLRRRSEYWAHGV